MCITNGIYIPAGGSVSIVEKNQWWERVEVSSNPHAKDNLTDGDPTTSWESAGRSGNHWIHIFMKKGVVIRWASITVLGGH